MAGMFDLELQPGELVAAIDEHDEDADDQVDHIEVDETVDVRRRIDDPQLSSDPVDVVPITAHSLGAAAADGVNRVGPIDFELLKVLGKGGYGKGTI